MTLKQLMKAADAHDREAGFHVKEYHPAVAHMLIVTEVAEATECVRNGEASYWKAPVSGKPMGEVAELADVILRVCSYAQAKGFNLERAIKEKIEYNKTRKHRHGGKSF
jgi:NTP pyrophosphatase (non-canonical NTP hydrolase)